MNPQQSGMLRGGGVRGARVRRHIVRGRSLKNFPDVHITDDWRIKREVPDFDPDVEYSERELLLLAEKLLLCDEKPHKEAPYILSANRLRQRQRREVYVESGVPAPHLVQGLYWRTHPQGRRFQTEDSTSSFYVSK